MKKEFIVKKAVVCRIKIPLIYPFRTALGQHDELENVIFALELNDGTRGYGEAAVASHISAETLAKTEANLKTAADMIKGKDISDYLNLSSALCERFGDNKSAVAAVEISLMDALSRRWKIPLWKFFGASPVRLATDITIVISGLDETEAAVKKFYRQGFRVFKVKIGRDQDMDLKRVFVLKRMAPEARIYLDANQGYNAKDTLRFLNILKRGGIVPALIEQPVAKENFEGLCEVSRLSNTLVCADESACSLGDVLRIIRCRAAGAINIKLMKFGLFKAREAYFLCKANNIKLMIGAMMETSLSVTAAAHLAGGLGGFDYVDLDCHFFIKKGRDKNPYLTFRGVYDVSKIKAGIGIVPPKI